METMRALEIWAGGVVSDRDMFAGLLERPMDIVASETIYAAATS